MNTNEKRLYERTGIIQTDGSFYSIGNAGNGLSIDGICTVIGGSLKKKAIITDERIVSGRTGIEYGGDYSTSFTNRSLIDKSYADTKLNISTFNDFSGTTLSNTFQTLQLLDTIGGFNVNNIFATPITWSSQVFSGTNLTFTGGSRIYMRANGVYGISYVLNVNSENNDGKNIGTVIRKNGNIDITPMSSVSFALNLQNDSGTNMMSEYLLSLLDGDYIELMAFRIEGDGILYTKKNGSWIKIIKIK